MSRETVRRVRDLTRAVFHLERRVTHSAPRLLDRLLAARSKRPGRRHSRQIHGPAPAPAPPPPPPLIVLVILTMGRRDGATQPARSPEDVGMRQPVHELHFVQHVLPVGREQVHLEHHHLVGHPVSHL